MYNLSFKSASSLWKILLILCPDLIFGQIFRQTIKRLPDTGQNQSYTNTFGEDHDYSIHLPVLLDLGDGTVLDTITGLQWQRLDGGEMTYEQSILYTNNLKLGGFDDWRLPLPIEAFSLLNHQNNNPALAQPPFEKNGAEYWWTSSHQVNDTNKIWVTNAGGGIGNHSKFETISAGGTKKFHAKAVREINSPLIIPARFRNNGDGTVTDLAYNLVWTRTPSADSMDWESALKYSENLNYAGSEQWRLPNIKELKSISDDKFFRPSVDKNFFSILNSGKFWSSTSLANQGLRAWFLDTQYGITTYDLKSRKNYILCVRTVDTPNAIHDFSIQNQYIVYPNPCNVQLIIRKLENNNNSGIMIKILNQIGQTIFETNWNSRLETMDLDTRDLPNGMYTLQIFSENNSSLKLIQIQHD